MVAGIGCASRADEANAAQMRRCAPDATSSLRLKPPEVPRRSVASGDACHSPKKVRRLDVARTAHAESRRARCNLLIWRRTLNPTEVAPQQVVVWPPHTLVWVRTLAVDKGRPANEYRPAAANPDERLFGGKRFVTRSPIEIPNFLAVPAFSSSTARAGPPDEMRRSDSGSAFCSIRRMRPSLLMKIISSGIRVSFIHIRIS